MTLVNAKGNKNRQIVRITHYANEGLEKRKNIDLSHCFSNRQSQNWQYETKTAHCHILLGLPLCDCSLFRHLEWPRLGYPTRTPDHGLFYRIVCRRIGANVESRKRPQRETGEDRGLGQRDGAKKENGRGVTASEGAEASEASRDSSSTAPTSYGQNKQLAPHALPFPDSLGFAPGNRE